MMPLLRVVTLVAVALSLLTIVACASGEEGETTPTGATGSPQATVTPTVGQGEGEATSVGAATPTPEATVTPTIAQGEAIEMGIDPETSGNTASALGGLESCVRVDVPSSSFDGLSDYSIDVYVKGDTQAPLAYDAWVTYDATKVHIAAPATSTLIKLPGATDFSDSVPDADGMFMASVVYLPTGEGIAGDGALLRLGLDIGGSGVVTFGFDPRPAATAYALVAGVPPVTRRTALLAINEDCPR